MKIFSWGANSYGQLSLGIQAEENVKPTEIKYDNVKVLEVDNINGGGGHTLLLDKQGKVFGCGCNNKGQLTGNLKDNTVLMTSIGALQTCVITQIACGWDSSYALTQEGTVFVWGSNKYGQLGISIEKVVIVKDPIKLDLDEVVQISAGLRHAALIHKDGSVYTSGSGHKGQLGLMGDNKSPVLHNDGFQKVIGVKNARQVSCGQHHIIAVTIDCKVFVWGDNKYGQLGLDPAKQPRVFAPRHLPLDHLNPLNTNVVSYSGWTHCALLTGGEVINWGRNSYNQLGEKRELPWYPAKLPGLSEVKQLSLGSEHNLALLSTGTILSWGWNEHGNCGCEGHDNVETPVSLKLPGDCIKIGTGSGHNFAVIK